LRDQSIRNVELLKEAMITYIANNGY